MDDIEQMLLQLREHKGQIDKLIEQEPQGTPRWRRLCDAWDAIDDAILKLEGV